LMIIGNSNIESWSADKLEKELTDKCLRPLGTSAPISVKQLQVICLKIIEESCNLSSGLGIGN